MTTFDEVIPILRKIFQQQQDVKAFQPILINRDLNGRVRLIVDEKWKLFGSLIDGLLPSLHTD